MRQPDVIICILISPKLKTKKSAKKRFKVTPPTSVTALSDLSQKDLKTVWFNSRFFRANLLWEKGTMRFRDIHLFNENLESEYLRKRGTSTQCFYSTLPLVDGFVWSSPEAVAGLRLKTGGGREIKGGDPVVDDRTEGELSIRWPVISPKGEIRIIFSEASMKISGDLETHDDWFLELGHASNAELPFQRTDDGKLSCLYKGFSYSVSAKQGHFKSEPGMTLKILPQDHAIVLDFSADASAAPKSAN